MWSMHRRWSGAPNQSCWHDRAPWDFLGHQMRRIACLFWSAMLESLLVCCRCCCKPYTTSRMDRLTATDLVHKTVQQAPRAIDLTFEPKALQQAQHVFWGKRFSGAHQPQGLPT